MGDFCDRLNIRNVVLWITDGLDVNRLRFAVDCSGEVLWVVAVDKFDINTYHKGFFLAQSRTVVSWILIVCNYQVLVGRL